MLVALLAAVANAATLVSLPPGEPADAWAEPLALAGLAPGGAGSPVSVVEDGGRWRVTVTDAAGATRVVFVDPPRSAQAREDVAWLLASLARPVGYRAPAPASTALPRPVVPAPPPRRVAPPPRPVEPEPVAVAEAPAWPPPEAVSPGPMADVAPPPEPMIEAPVAPPPPEPRAVVSPWARVGGGVWGRAALAPVGRVGVGAGAELAGGWRLGGALGLATPGTLADLGGGRTLTGLDADGLVGWSGAGRLAPWAQLGPGIGLRVYREQGDGVADVLVPTAALAAGGRLVLAPSLGLTLGVEGRCDLRATDVVAPDATVSTLPPCAAGLSAGLELVGPRARPAIQAAATRHQEDT